MIINFYTTNDHKIFIVFFKQILCRKKNGEKKNDSDSDSEEDPEKKKFNEQISGAQCFK